MDASRDSRRRRLEDAMVSAGYGNMKTKLGVMSDADLVSMAKGSDPNADQAADEISDDSGEGPPEEKVETKPDESKRMDLEVFRNKAGSLKFPFP
eukprot:8001629-Pyramimonas_sp.AAC.1